LGQVKALVTNPREIKRALRPKQTMHDMDYFRVAAILYQTREGMKPGQIYQDVRCPICGSMTAFVLNVGPNVGKICVAACSMGCFECWE
jgi:hypothetical protein